MVKIIITKKCSTCKESKLFTEFHRNKAHRDGFQNVCKECFYVLNQTENRKKYMKLKSIRYAQTPQGRENAKRRIRKYRLTDKGKKAQDKYYSQRRINHPEEQKAHIAIMHEVQNNKLEPIRNCACYYCSEQAQIYHHPRGYDDKHILDVIALCSSCHKNIHKAITIIGGSR